LTNLSISPRVILGLIIPGLGLTTTLLALFGYAAWNTVSRRYLDRVSFRLLTYAQVAQYVDLCSQVYTTHHASLVFGVSFSLSSLAGYTDWRCSLLSFLANVCLFTYVHSGTQVCPPTVNHYVLFVHLLLHGAQRPVSPSVLDNFSSETLPDWWSCTRSAAKRWKNTTLPGPSSVVSSATSPHTHPAISGTF
jgi:hypothetical protein